MHAARAPVKPRFISRSTGDALCLEESVSEAIRHFHQGVIEISGPTGAGKTFALRHLAAVLSQNTNVVYLDRSAGQDSIPSNKAVVMEVETISNPTPDCIVRFELAPWGSDELIEYSLACHPDHCKSVIGRLLAAPDRELLGGCPELCSLVLDRMAEDPNAASIAEVLRSRINELTLANPSKLPLATRLLLPEVSLETDADSETLSPELLRLLQHRSGRTVAGAMLVADLLNRRDVATLHALQLVASIIHRKVVIDLICRWVGEEGIGCLRDELLCTDRPALYPLFATILIRRDPSWKPDIRVAPRLDGAVLKLANWPGADLRRFELSVADLSGSNLRRALLIATRANATDFSGACLQDARLRRIKAHGANFQDADLRKTMAANGQFVRANFLRADARASSFAHADLSDANLAQADFRDADLRNACLSRAIFAETDLSNADLIQAVIHQTDLSNAVLDDAIFEHASLIGSSFEFVNLPSARFDGANLSLTLMTGSSMPNGRFREAELSRAFLADIHWPDVDLRGANLRGATFHMGSSRSGLVDSVIASEGTRTGFYSNDFDERLYRQPEEIRAANLRGCDLRGANIQGVDFYRVDLRGAQIDPEQRAQMQATGAFLD